MANNMVRIDEIKIGKRYRKDMGNLSPLIQSIEILGLLHPIVILRDKKLVVGQRRIAAFRMLQRERIPVRVIESLRELDRIAEHDENICRLDFDPVEGVAAGRGRAEIADDLAKDEQKKSPGRPKKTDADDKGRGNSPTFIQDDSARSKARQAKVAGMDRKTFIHAEAVIDSGNKELIEEMRKTRRVNGVYRKLQKLKQAEEINKEPPPLPAGPFRVIVADPPWHYNKRPDDPSQRGSLPYPSMTIEDIKALDVAGLAHDDAVLWLWTTNAHLPEAFGVVEAWGFTYKTLLTWTKPKMGLGDWLRGKTEHCLLCVRGKPTVTLTNQTTVIEGKSGKHSEKPEEFYQLVEDLCPGGKLEMFSRKKREGWTQHGNEIDA